MSSVLFCLVLAKKLWERESSCNQNNATQYEMLDADSPGIVLLLLHGINQGH